MILGFLPTEAVGNIVKFLGMHPCERSDKVPDNKNTHTLFLAGKQHFLLGRAWVICSLGAIASWAVGSHWEHRESKFLVLKIHKAVATSSQDGGVDGHTLPPCTTIRRITTNLKTKNTQDCQKIELCGSLTKI